MTADILKKLRNREPVKLFDKANQIFVHIQFNKKEKEFVCWERWTSKDRRTWINQNLYLSLKEVDTILNNIKSTYKN